MAVSNRHIPLIAPGRYGGTRHVGYVDMHGDLFTVHGNPSYETRTDPRGGVHSNKAHFERVAAFEILQAVMEGYDEADD